MRYFAILWFMMAGCPVVSMEEARQGTQQDHAREEAEKNIQEAKRYGIKFVAIQIKDLTTLPDSIGQLSNVQHLFLENIGKFYVGEWGRGNTLAFRRPLEYFVDGRCAIEHGIST